jgi:hypothetical protein
MAELPANKTIDYFDMPRDMVETKSPGWAGAVFQMAVLEGT